MSYDKALPQKSRSALEQLIVVVGLIGVMGMGLNPALAGDAGLTSSSQSDPLISIVRAMAAVYGCWGIATILRAWRWNASAIALVALHVLICVSLFWSDARALTALRSAQLVATSLFALTIGARFSLQEQLRLLFLACASVAVVNVLYIIASPDIGTMHGEFEGAWRGAFVHKNQLGKFGVLWLSVSLLHRRATDSARHQWWIGIAASLILVLGSTSRTALLSSIAVIFSVPAIRYLRRQRSLLPHLTGLITVLLAVGSILWLNAAAIAEAMGKDLTMSGRTALWFAVTAFIVQRPWLGYGFAAFWRGLDGDSAYISLALHWDVPHAHNGWLDLALDVGVVGLVLGAALFALAVRKSFGVAGSATLGQARYWPLLSLCFVFMANLTESSLVRPSSITWVLLVLASTVETYQLEAPQYPATPEDNSSLALLPATS